MGIYDRQYVRVGPHSRSGLGSLRFLSFNSWLIIINVAVFILGAMTAGQVVPVIRGFSLDASADPRHIDVRPELFQPAQVVDPLGRVLPDGRNLQQVQSPISGRIYYRPILDTRSGQIVGVQEVTMMPWMHAWGHFSTAQGFFGLELWRFVTFQFLHGTLMHIVFNMFGLWIFGGMVEQYLGSRRYAAFYLTCGIFGAVGYLLLNFLGNILPPELVARIPGLLSDSIYTPLVGASAGVFGVILACAYIAPNAIVQLLFPPIPLKLKWMAYAYVAFAAYNLLTSGHNAGGDAAHLGGAIAGAFFIRNAHLLRDFFEILGRSPRAERRGPILADDDTEVDRILGKVDKGGLESLSDREKRTLRRASDRRRARDA
jgi:membrane associated rhomboid family serine protease